VNPKLEGVNTAIVLGESGGVGCSSGLIDRSVGGSLHSHLNSIEMCCGDSCRFPVRDEGCELDQLGGPSLLTNGLSSVRGCLGNGVVQMGGICGSHDDDATGGEDSDSGESSFRFPVTGSDWILSHSGGVGLLVIGSFSVRGFFGNRGVVQLGVIETIRGNCNEDVTRGDHPFSFLYHHHGFQLFRISFAFTSPWPSPASSLWLVYRHLGSLPGDQSP